MTENKEFDLEKLKNWMRTELVLASAKDPDKETMYQAALEVVHGLYLASKKDKTYSFEKLRDIVVNLLFQQPLTPIEGVDEDWDLVDDSDGFKQYQCNRYPSLYKGVLNDGSKTRYVDQNRYICVDINNPKRAWTGGIGAKVLEDVCPIEFPYYPNPEKIKVYMEQFLYHKDDENTDENKWDTVAVTYLWIPDAGIKEVYRFFKTAIINGEPDMVEITKQEYFSRKVRYEQRKAKEKNY